MEIHSVMIHLKIFLCETCQAILKFTWQHEGLRTASTLLKKSGQKDLLYQVAKVTTKLQLSQCGKGRKKINGQNRSPKRELHLDGELIQNQSSTIKQWKECPFQKMVPGQLDVQMKEIIKPDPGLTPYKTYLYGSAQQCGFYRIILENNFIISGWQKTS